MKIRDFIYLDSGRMYSLYSQVFEGIAEKVTNTYFDRLVTGNSIKKTIGHDEARSEAEETLEEIESKVMYDNLYNKLEERLADSIEVIDSDCKKIDFNNISKSFLFKIVGNAHIFDYSRLKEFTDKFNKLGEIIATSIYSNLSESNRSKTSVKQIIKDKGLSQDKTLLSNLKYIAEFFSNNSFEILIDPYINDSDIVFMGILDRDYLRIDEDRLRHLYGNEPSMQWIMVGQLTNVPEEDTQGQTPNDESETSNSDDSVSDSFENMMRAANEVEKVYSVSKRYKKIRLAPIAIYVEKEISSQVQSRSTEEPSQSSAVPSPEDASSSDNS